MPTTHNNLTVQTCVPIVSEKKKSRKNLRIIGTVGCNYSENLSKCGFKVRHKEEKEEKLKAEKIH
jgi:hypothetical protein